MSQTVTNEFDPDEKPGARPYEMTWANRKEPAQPTVKFDDLSGWTMKTDNGAQAELRVTRTQNIWDRPVAKLHYRGDGKPSPVPHVLLVPPRPVPISEGSDSIDMWMFGNRWSWVDPPDTPALRVVLHFRTAVGDAAVEVDSVRWEEWWLMHRKLPAMKYPAYLVSIEFAGGWQPDWKDVYLDSIRFYKEAIAPISFDARPKRNLALPKGQAVGANTGPGKLPFPTREETILPMQMGGAFTNSVGGSGKKGWVFRYKGKDANIVYRFYPAKGLSGLKAEVDGSPYGTLMDGGGIGHADGASLKQAPLVKTGLSKRVVTAEYADGTVLTLRIRQKSLVLDVANRSCEATDLRFGALTGLIQPRAIWMPYMTYGGSNPSIALAKAGRKWAYASIWPDWYRSNGSELYGAEQASGNTARINGGVRYVPATDGKRNPMFERVFITVSPRLEETLPVVPNPQGIHAKMAVDRLWQESWGPDDFKKQEKRSEMIRAYGIDKLIQCNHEISWRDGGESFTLRTHAAPKKGGDAAQQEYVKHQRGLGWYSGLYTNYTDFIPVNEHWDPDKVQRQPDGEWRSAWPRCWAEKPLAAVQFDALLAPQIEARYKTNTAYTDVQTAVAPWNYCDFDARVPGAATFAQTFYCYGELLRNDSRVYKGPIFSEGTYQWMYAGLADGNYALAYNGRPLAVEPLLPIYDLYQIHTKECDIGMAWTSYFCDAIPNWHAPENIDRAIDRFILNTMAYGHIGWLVEEDHTIRRTCRSYYMLQQVQSRYGLKTPIRIAYWDGKKLRSVSDAVPTDIPRTRRQLYVEYPSVKLWLNDHPTESWTVKVGKKNIVLPPAGWAAEGTESQGTGRKKTGVDDGALLSYSALDGTNRVDYLRSEAYIYLDGRGINFNASEASTAGAIAIYPEGKNRLRVINVTGNEFTIRRPFGVRGIVNRCKAFDAEGKQLASPVFHESGIETRVEPVKNAVRYELAFDGKLSWYIVPACSELAPGSTVEILTHGIASASWHSSSGTMKSSSANSQALSIPAEAPVGSEIVVTAIRCGSKREAFVRVCAPVEWSLESHSTTESTTVRLKPTWHLSGLNAKEIAVVVSVTDGWTVSPSKFTLSVPTRTSAFALPSELVSILTSSAAPETEGTLNVTLTGVPGAVPTTFHLRRELQQAIVMDMQAAMATWGITKRNQPDTIDAAGTGAVFYTDNSLAVGTVTHKGLFMHPPYVGGTGRTWAETGELTMPDKPCEFHALIGLRDGGDPSDGVVYILEVINAKGNRAVAGQALGVQREWRDLKADLSAFAGKRIRLRLIADVGPADNSAADWACWGEPVIRLLQPGVVTAVK